MLFNSFEFVMLFLPIAYGIYHLGYRYGNRISIVILILFSLIFYAYWNINYLLLLLASVFCNYVLHRVICRCQGEARGKILLYVGIVLNLGLIGYYKYYNFFADNIAVLCGKDFHNLDIFLPLGISFFTFQQIACLVDTYKGEMEAAGICEYVLFVTFFPQLIAGPIVRATEIVPQIKLLGEKISSSDVKFGLTLFSFGLFKKVVIADYFSPIAVILYSTPEMANFYDALLGSLAYTMQIYFDFSGYSDMAIGLGMLFGIKLPINFDSPYKSTSIIEFWRRWHMTLSQFLRDYLYIPLGGSRKGEVRRYVNLLTTMLLGGLWHGAGWTFVLWGGTHGIYLGLNHWWRRKNIKLTTNKAWLMTFIAVWFAWILFRADTLEDVGHVLAALTGNNGFAWGNSLLSHNGYTLFKVCSTLFLSVIACKYLPNSYQIVNKIQHLPQSVYALIGGILLACALHIMTYTNRVSEFLYFQF